MIGYSPSTPDRQDTEKFFEDAVIHSPRGRLPPGGGAPAQHRVTLPHSASSRPNPFRRSYQVKTAGDIVNVTPRRQVQTTNTSAIATPRQVTSSPFATPTDSGTPKLLTHRLVASEHNDGESARDDTQTRAAGPSSWWFSSTATSQLVPGFERMVQKVAASFGAQAATSVNTDQHDTHSTTTLATSSTSEWVAQMYSADVFPALVCALGAVSQQRDELEKSLYGDAGGAQQSDSDANLLAPSVSLSDPPRGQRSQTTRKRRAEPPSTRSTTSVGHAPTVQGEDVTRKTSPPPSPLPGKAHSRRRRSSGGARRRSLHSPGTALAGTWLGELAALMDPSSPTPQLHPTLMRSALCEAPTRRTAAGVIMRGGVGSIAVAAAVCAADVLLATSLLLVNVSVMQHPSEKRMHCNVAAFVAATAAIATLRQRLWDGASNQPATLRGNAALLPNVFLHLKQWMAHSSNLTNALLRTHAVVMHRRTPLSQAIQEAAASSVTAPTTQSSSPADATPIEPAVDAEDDQQLREQLCVACAAHASQMTAAADDEARSGVANPAASMIQQSGVQAVRPLTCRSVVRMALDGTTLPTEGDGTLAALHRTVASALQMCSMGKQRELDDGAGTASVAPTNASSNAGTGASRPLSSATHRPAPSAVRRRSAHTGGRTGGSPASVLPHASPPAVASPAHWLRAFSNSMTAYRGDLAVFLTSYGAPQHGGAGGSSCAPTNRSRSHAPPLTCANFRRAVAQYMTSTLQSHVEHQQAQHTHGDAVELDDEVGVVSLGIPWPLPLALLQELINIHGSDAVVKKQLLVSAASLIAGDTTSGRSSGPLPLPQRDATGGGIDQALVVLRQWLQCFHPDVVAPSVQGSGAPQRVCDAARREATAHAQRIVWLRDALYSM